VVQRKENDKRNRASSDILISEKQSFTLATGSGVDEMSLSEFWGNVRRAAQILTPRTTVDSPKMDRGAIEQTLRGTTLWLTPHAVAGFHEADFRFLPDADRTKLEELVNEFRQIAVQIPRKATATAEQIEQALPLFRDIVLMLDFDHCRDPEAYRIGKKIEQSLAGDRPPELADLWFQTGTDSTGDPGIWIWGILSEEEEEPFLQLASEIRLILDEASRSVAPELFPYTSFRSVGDQAELLEFESSGACTMIC